MPYTLDIEDDIAAELDESLEAVRIVYHLNQPKHREEE